MAKDKPQTIHIAFKSAETGRYLFHIKWPLEQWRLIETAAKISNMSIEEFINKAIMERAKELLGDSSELL